MATAKPKPVATCSLTLTIAGVPYRCRPVEAPAGFRRAFRLAKVDGKGGTVAHIVCGSTAGSLACDCDGFRFRKDCRHVRAARVLGML